MTKDIRSIFSSLARARRLAALSLVLAFGSMALAAPAHVIIRTAAGVAAPEALAALLANWRQSGAVADVLFLTDGRPEKTRHPAAFGVLAILDFPNYDSADAWRRDAASALPAGLIVRRADTLAHGEIATSDRRPASAVFVVNNYTSLVSATRFSEYVQGYVKPLYEAMCGTRHLVRYTVYLERGETGKAEVLNVLEYRDAAGLASLGKLKAGLRAQVAAATPTYAAFDKIKDQLRIDGVGTVATGTELPALQRRTP